jgi:hypothetical protein
MFDGPRARERPDVDGPKAIQGGNERHGFGASSIRITADELVAVERPIDLVQEVCRDGLEGCRKTDGLGQPRSDVFRGRTFVDRHERDLARGETQGDGQIDYERLRIEGGTVGVDEGRDGIEGHGQHRHGGAPNRRFVVCDLARPCIGRPLRRCRTRAHRIARPDDHRMTRTKETLRDPTPLLTGSAKNCNHGCEKDVAVSARTT